MHVFKSYCFNLISLILTTLLTVHYPADISQLYRVTANANPVFLLLLVYIKNIQLANIHLLNTLPRIWLD